MRLTNPLPRAFPLMLALGCAPVGLVCGAAGLFCTPAAAQQLIGYVNTRDAEVTGSTDVLNGQTVLTGSVGVTAKDHPAPILLGRGGTARVCQSSVLHITESRSANTGSRAANSADSKDVNGAGAANAPLLFSLESGAIEIQMNGTASDAIMTPDLRFSVLNQGTLDVRVRVARNGDTCVENRGVGAPTLAVSDPFGESMYEVPGGQHVLFQHGSLHDVVDNETAPCGCPAVAPGMSVGDALLASGGANQGPTLATAPPPAPPPPVVVQVAPQVVVAPASAAASAPNAAATPAAANPPQVVVAPAVPATNPAGTSAVSAATTEPTITQAAASAPARAAAPVSGPVTAAGNTMGAAAANAPAGDATAPIATSAPAPATVTTPDAAAEQAALQAAEETAAQAAIRAAELRHPFPEVSQAQPDASPPVAGQVATGQAHVQISDSMSYNAPTAPGAASVAKPAMQPAPAPIAAKPAPPPAPVHRNVLQSIGHFFKWMFVG